MTRTLTTLSRNPVGLALYRYGHLYVSQGRDLTIVDPSGNTERQQLAFTPGSWASYGGQVTLYDRYAGVICFAGNGIVAESHTPGRRYAAPYATPMADGVPLVGGHEALDGEEINGLMMHAGKIPGHWYLPVQRQHVPSPVVAAGVELDHWITFSQDAQRFSSYNGTTGRLLYGRPPHQLVPYLYPDQGLIAAGTADGYLFSPDLGLSWRRRQLDGWGVLTERSILQVSPARGVEILEGWW